MLSVHESISFCHGPDLETNVEGEFESLFIEAYTEKEQVIIGVIRLSLEYPELGMSYQ